jgi:hypothetical protein
MKALTIWQPWASLIVAGAKPYEFRPRSFRDYVAPPAAGDRIVIHAGARRVVPAEVRDLLLKLHRADRRGPLRLDWLTALNPDVAVPLLERTLTAPGILPLGAGLGTAVLGAATRCTEVFGKEALPRDSDRIDKNIWAWPLESVERWEPIVPMEGARGFWRWPT